jgi:beta-glucuronidase
LRLTSGEATIAITSYIRNTSRKEWSGRTSYRLEAEASGRTVLTGSAGPWPSVKSGKTETQTMQVVLTKVKLWHFDHPNLYSLEFSITGTGESHCFPTIFGIRKLEAKDGAFHLNGERVRLMGVERMAGSNPEFGMAEPEEWIWHDHADLKHLNCIFAVSIGRRTSAFSNTATATGFLCKPKSPPGDQIHVAEWGRNRMPTSWRMDWNNCAR